MKKRERVMAVIEGNKPDKIPSGFWLHFEKGYEYGEDSVQKHLDFFEQSKTDLCKVMNENLLPQNMLLSKAEGWGKLNPISEDEPFFKNQVELVRRVCEEVDGKAVVLATIHGIVACAFHYLGGPDLYDNDKLAVTRHMRENPEAFRHGLSIIADYTERLCIASLKAGADGIYFASLGGEVNMMTDEEFETFFKPLEIRILNAIQEVPCFNLLHMCKDGLNLKRYLGYPANVLNWGVHENNLSLTEGKELFGADKILLGGMDDRAGVLVEGTKEDIVGTVHEVLDEIGTERFLLGADCTLPTDIDLIRIKTAVEATKSYQTK